MPFASRRQHGQGQPSRRRPTFALAAASAALALGAHAAPAGAAIIAQPLTDAGATAIAEAIQNTPVGATGKFDAIPPSGTPNGTANAPVGSFPTDPDKGPFGVLTSGNVEFADDPNSSTETSEANGGGSVRGNTDRDVTILRIPFTAPSGANCLTFDFQFLSEEFPEFVGSSFNDAFIAELDKSTWTTSGSTISAPDNFAFDDDGNVVSINSSGPTSLTAANAEGTTYDGATKVLSASSQLSPGAHVLYLSIFDQGDQALDSAVFLDNLVVGFVPDPSQRCAEGAAVKEFDLSLSPATAANPTGTDHTVTATLEEVGEDGGPVSGGDVLFSVTGANPTTGMGTTDGDGKATFTYTGTNAGQDTIVACYDEDDDGTCDTNEVTASATKTWNDPGGGEDGDRLVGLTRQGGSGNVQKLRFFAADAPATVVDRPITGVPSNEQLIGIDSRPATGELFGVSRRFGSRQLRLYRIDPASGAATLVGLVSSSLGFGFAGVDFNPTVDRVRFVTTDDRNARINPAGGAALNDGRLAYAGDDPNEDVDPRVAASAYTNNTDGATSTELYGIDDATDSLVLQAPPNAGTLQTIGKLGTTLTPELGFDISGATGTAYAAIRPVRGKSQLRTVDLSTGKASLVGQIGNGQILEGLAVLPGGTPAQ